VVEVALGLGSGPAPDRLAVFTAALVLVRQAASSTPLAGASTTAPVKCGHRWTRAIPHPFRIRASKRSTQILKNAFSGGFARPPLHCGEVAREAFETDDLRGL
jgi:hypothetical protein